MLDILQLRANPEELEQLRLCQATPRGDCLAAFTVRRPGQIWPIASWNHAHQERINVRGWFPLLDQIADEFLLWWPKGGCFFVSRERVTYRPLEHDPREVMFLQFEAHRLTVVPPRQLEPVQAYSAS